MHSEKMTRTEKQAVVSLSAIMSLRMIGLFMVLPVFSLYASQLKGANPITIGLAMGVYGLAQALFQIPFGALSDRVGRKPIIFSGLLIFVTGSILAGMANTMTWMILGRTLQGVGAVGSTTLAMMADLTREGQRTKAMAVTGMVIGLSFAVAMLIGPLLTKWLSVGSLFFIAAGFGCIGITLLYTYTPSPTTLRWHRDAEPELHAFLKLLLNPELSKLNIGIFVLHAVFTACFVVIPISLVQTIHLPSSQQWEIYLPTLLAGFSLTLFAVSHAERKQKIKPYFSGAIGALGVAELLLWQHPANTLLLGAGLTLFFASFSLLEAFLPSLISRCAPADRKGSAMGIYSCSQFLGIFAGGFLGGWLFGQFSFSGTYLFCLCLTLFWFTLSLLMQPPRHWVTQLWRITSQKSLSWSAIAQDLQKIPGVIEAIYIAEDETAYLKVEQATTQNPDFIRLKEQLQSG
jgi:MFS family permease